ncbi:MAG: hypothetical protein WC975_12965 [Phycisphaerae bacterium]
MPTSKGIVAASTILTSRYFLSLLLFTLIFAPILNAASPATQPATTDQDQSPPPGGLHLSYMEGDLQFESRYDARRVKTPRDPFTYGTQNGTKKNRSWELRETMGLRLGGDVLYPEFINFNADLRLGLDQLSSFENSWLGRLHDNDNGWIGEYNVNADFFSRKPVNFSLTALHQNERISRQFLPSLEHERWKYGGTVRWQNEFFPMELTLETSRDKYTGNSDLFDDEDVRETLLHYTGTLNVSQYHQLRIDAQRSRINEQYSGSDFKFKTTRNTINLDDRIEFGSQHQHLFETLLEYEEDQGDLPRDHLNVGPQFTLNHSEIFSTRYKYQYNRDTYENFRLQSHRFDFEPTLRLGDLTTTGDVYISHETSNEEMTGDDVGGLVRWDYRRKNSLGNFSTTLGYHYDDSRTRFDKDFGQVIDEVVYFQDPLPGYLAQTNVVSGSIVVTSLARTRVFLPGKDYTVITLGTRTALLRVPFGTIKDKDTVRVRYLYKTSEKITAQTNEADLRVQQNFNSGWTPYYAVNLRRQQLDYEGVVPVEPNNLNRHRLGLTYRKARWSGGGEFEFNHDSVDPYNALHANADWSILNRLPHQLDLHTSVSRFWFTGGEDRRASLFDISLDYRHPLIRRVDFTARGAYRYENDTLQGQTNGIDFCSGFQYRIGLLAISCDVEYDKLAVAGTRDDGLSVWIKIRRDIPDLLGLGRRQ